MWNKAPLPFLLFILTLVSACGSQKRDVAVTEIWDESRQAKAQWNCEGVATKPEGRVLPVSVFLGQGVQLDQVKRTLDAASDALATYGIALEVDSDTQWLPKENLITIDPSKLRRLVKKGVGQAKLEAKLLGGIKVLIQTHSRPRIERTHWIFLKEIVPETGLAFRILGDVAGVGLSPELVAKAKKEEVGSSWVQAAGLEGDFTPTLVVGTRSLRKKSEKEVGLILAHELGHAFGLPHTTGETGDLMGLDLPACIPALTDEQAEAFSKGTRSK